MKKLKYHEFVNSIDIDEFEAAINFYRFETSSKGEDRGHCPDIWGLHSNGDRSGKFYINRDKKVYNCWVCGGGSLLSLTMEIRDCTEQEATDWLYQFTVEVDQTDDEFITELDQLLSEHVKDVAVLPYFNKKVIGEWATLYHPFFEERGISEEVKRDFYLGYNPEAKRLSSRGTHRGEAIIFPHFWGGRLVGWQERWLGDRPQWLPKYTNTGAFPKSETLFGYEDVYFSTSPIVVVESVPTCLFLKSIHIPAIATFGSSVTDEQMRLLRGCQQGLVISPDNDDAGEKFKNHIEAGLEDFVKIYNIDPVGEEKSDLGDLSNDPESVLQLYVEAIPANSFDADTK